MSPLPASRETFCLYITYLSRSCKYSTISCYVSTVHVMHDYFGAEHPSPSDFVLRSTLRGARRLVGDQTRQVDPLGPGELMKILSILDLRKFEDLRFWCALLLSFRCVLRAGHVSFSPHALRVKHVAFKSISMDVCVISSKTVQFRERVHVVPVIESPISALCPVRYLKRYISWSGLGPDDYLFPVSYWSYLAQIKASAQRAGLSGEFGTHSLRRGAASFLARFLPLHDVKAYGDWRSLSVLLYLSDSYSARCSKDFEVSRRLAHYS